MSTSVYTLKIKCKTRFTLSDRHLLCLCFCVLLRQTSAPTHSKKSKTKEEKPSLCLIVSKLRVCRASPEYECDQISASTLIFVFFNLQKKLCFLKAFVHGVEKLLKKVSKNINFPFIENSILIEKLQYLKFCAKIYFGAKIQISKNFEFFLLN